MGKGELMNIIKDDDVIGVTNKRYKELTDKEKEYQRLQKWVKTMGIWGAFEKREVK